MKFDILIVGGGLVGNSLAWLLAQQDFKIGVVEAKPFTPSTDNRSIVITYSSQLILQTLGLWEKISSQAFPIKKIHVSHENSFGAARFVAQEIGIDAFGYVVPMAHLTNTLQQQVTSEKRIQWFTPAKVISSQTSSEMMNVTISSNLDGATQHQGTALSVDLLIAADGTHSQLRQLFNIPIAEHDYQQSAIITQVKLPQNHHQIAYERLTPSGPLAMLPREPQRCGVIWTVHQTQLPELLAMNETNFLAQLQQRFGYRLGKLMSVESRQHFPLRMLYAKQQVLSHFILLGNAAHTLHPIAGQGFNLALRDVAALGEILVAAKQAGENLGNLTLLNSYQQWRKQDHQHITYFTDRTVRLFSKDFFAAKSARSIGLLAADLIPFAKRQLVRRLLGLSGRTPKLVCNVPL